MQDTLKTLSSAMQTVKEADALSFWGSIASIIGIIGVPISLIALKIALTVRKYINIEKRIPYISAKISKSSEGIGAMLYEYDGKSHLLKVELGRCMADLKWLKKYSPNGERKNFDRVIGIGEAAQRLAEIPRETLENIHLDIEVIIQNLRNWRFDVLLEETQT